MVEYDSGLGEIDIITVLFAIALKQYLGRKGVMSNGSNLAGIMFSKSSLAFITADAFGSPIIDQEVDLYGAKLRAFGRIG